MRVVGTDAKNGNFGAREAQEGKVEPGVVESGESASDHQEQEASDRMDALPYAAVAHQRVCATDGSGPRAGPPERQAGGVRAANPAPPGGREGMG